MPRITKVYTRTGDDGTTALGGGQRRQKDHIRIEAYGTVDELSSTLGVALALGVQTELQETIRQVQNDLFNLGSDLCILEEDKTNWAVPGIEKRHVIALERTIDRLQESLEPLSNFILPGGTPAAAMLQLARAVCRRAERELVTLSREEKIGEWTLRYLNRLSDTLFVMARWENKKSEVKDPLWDSRA